MNIRSSRARPGLGALYAVLALLILAQGVWWVVFLIGQARDNAREAELRLAAERTLAQELVDAGQLDAAGVQARFPDLMLVVHEGTSRVELDPNATEGVYRKARRRERMLISEGSFFLVLLGLGSIVLLVAYRRQRDYRRAHELFLAGVTHEFRTPLASVRLSAETLERQDLSEDARGQVRRRLIADVDRLQGLVGHVLAVTRQEAIGRGDPEVIDLGTLAESIAAEVAALIEERHGVLELDLPSGRRVRGYKALLAVAVRNLVVNAIEHGHSGGTGPIVSMSLATRDGFHRLAIADQGPGIAKHEHARVFRSFYRLERSRSSPGAGLGLYLARRNVEAMGGSIELDSREGEGATFTLLLPVEPTK